MSGESDYMYNAVSMHSDFEFKQYFKYKIFLIVAGYQFILPIHYTSQSSINNVRQILSMD